MTPPEPDRLERPALAGALACFTMWGLLPLLFQAVGRAGAGSLELLAWRGLASLPVVGALVLASGRGPKALALLRQPRLLGALVGSALLIGINWGFYVWAVQHGQTLATSLGYYINPLLNVLFGALLFRERLSKGALVAVTLATVGVGLEALAIGGTPWTALILAGAFAGYGVIRKHIPVDAPTGLFAETLILLPPTLAYLAWQQQHAGGAFGRHETATLLLLSCGPATVVPLVLFAGAARRLPLSVLGFLQFLQPTMLFAIGVLGGEPVDAPRLAAFGFIWAGVAVFVLDAAWRARAPSGQGLPAQEPRKVA
jgi:chloramphenicol-sensitive protein RarD